MLVNLDDSGAPAVQLLSLFGHNVQKFKLQGNKLLPWPLGQNFMTLFNKFTHLQSLTVSRTYVFPDLDWLVYAPRTLTTLHLDCLTLPATEFLRHVPPLSGQLTELAMTTNPQLTTFDLVNILQYFNGLKSLDIRHSDYLTAGTVSTILQYCPYLKVFYLTTRLRVKDSRAWLQLVEVDYTEVEFSKQVYSDVRTHRWLLGMEEAFNDSDSE